MEMIKLKYSFKETKNQLEKNNFKFKKMFGQNFIIDSNVIHQIIKKSHIDKETLVIEIGPGAGALTKSLSEVAGQVLCYEIDSSLKVLLDQLLIGRENVKILYQDFLKSNLSKDICQYHYQKIYVVSNLPYYITTPIIMKLIEEPVEINQIIVMVQKEVGNRFYAIAGTRDYNSLSVFLNYYFDVKKILDVNRNSFYPRPNVDSIVVKFSRKENHPELKDTALFFQLIRDSFKQKRKNLKNNLKHYNLDIIKQVLSKYSLDLTVRAEQISIDIFIDLANHLAS